MLTLNYDLCLLDTPNNPRRWTIIALFAANCVPALLWQFAWSHGWFGILPLFQLLLAHAGVGAGLAYWYWRIGQEASPHSSRRGFEVKHDKDEE